MPQLIHCHILMSGNGKGFAICIPEFLFFCPGRLLLYWQRLLECPQTSPNMCAMWRICQVQRVTIKCLFALSVQIKKNKPVSSFFVFIKRRGLCKTLRIADASAPSQSWSQELPLLFFRSLITSAQKSNPTPRRNTWKSAAKRSLSACAPAGFLFCVPLKLFPGMTADGNNHHVETRFVIPITRKLVSLWFCGFMVALQLRSELEWVLFSHTGASVFSQYSSINPGCSPLAAFPTETSD